MLTDITVERRLSTTELDAAQNMQAWFGDYLYGLQEQPGPLPDLTVQRLERQFGGGERVEQLALIRDELMIFDMDHQPNLALYICGYPDDALEVLADGSIGEMLRLLDERFPIPVREVIVDAEPAPAATLLEGEAIPEKRATQLEILGRRATSAVVVVTPRATTLQPRPDYTYRRRGMSQSSIPDDWGIKPVDLGMPRLRRDEIEDDNPLAWQTDALCAQTDPEAFFPEKGGSTRDAKRICTSCDVKNQCLDYALQNDERFGIWGGLSERERRRLRRGRTGA